MDWWSFGILIYELLYGVTPFRGKKRDETFENILKRPLSFPEQPEVSEECKVRHVRVQGSAPQHPVMSSLGLTGSEALKHAWDLCCHMPSHLKIRPQMAHCAERQHDQLNLVVLMSALVSTCLWAEVTPCSQAGQDMEVHPCIVGSSPAPEQCKNKRRAPPQDLIRQLLERDPAKRLGAHAGAEEIKVHPFYEEINWVRPPQHTGTS